MRIVRSVSTNGNLYPDIYNFLISLPDEFSHHKEHVLLHPLAIYSKSIHRVTQAFKAVLDNVDALPNASIRGDYTLNFNPAPLLEAQKELLEALAAHLDDGYHILKALYPYVQLKKEERFADRWLEAAHHPTVKDFRLAIKAYKGTFIPIVNRMKHQHSRLCPIVFYNDLERIAGYYVEGVDKNERLGPAPEIHLNDTALSLNRDLRYHFTHLYIIGSQLLNAIVRALKKMREVDLNWPTFIKKDSSFLGDVAKRISRLPFVFFPDEVSKPTPFVSVYEDEQQVTKLVLEYPVVLHATGPVNGLRIFTQFNGDEVTKSWRLPYMNYSGYLPSF